MENEKSMAEQGDYQQWLEHFRVHINTCIKFSEEELESPDQISNNLHSIHFDDKAFYGWVLDQWDEFTKLSSRKELNQYADKLLANNPAGPVNEYVERLRLELQDR
jgi:hypothetical protein